MNKYKVCVYAICKNEEKFVDRWMDSMREADVIVITDTGSTDKTVEKLKERGAIVYNEKIEPWRFDTARNISLSHVPDDIDICVCTDLDEVFNSGWREALEKAWDGRDLSGNNSVYRGKYLYNWSLKPDNSPDVQFVYSKIHERKGFKWDCPVHEYLFSESGKEEKSVFIKDMVLNHYPDSTKSRSSYLPLLELAVEETPQNGRMRYYLGREYMYKGEWKKCIDTLKAYLKLPKATWNEERCAAMRWIAKSNFMQGNTQKAYSWYYRAIAEAPHMRDAYIEFAKICYELKEWHMVLFLTEEALKIKEKSGTFVNMGYSWDYTPHDLYALAAFYLGLYAKSLEHAKMALKFSPNNERLKNNLKIIENYSGEIV